MTTELKQAAQQALLALEKSQPHPSNPVIGLTKQDFIDHEETIRQLRAAIQQAEAQQPTTPERVPMTDEEIGYWYSRTPSNFVFSHFKAAIRSAEAHHGIAAKAKKETP